MGNCFGFKLMVLETSQSTRLKHILTWRRSSSPEAFQIGGCRKTNFNWDIVTLKWSTKWTLKSSNWSPTSLTWCWPTEAPEVPTPHYKAKSIQLYLNNSNCFCFVSWIKVSPCNAIITAKLTAQHMPVYMSYCIGVPAYIINLFMFNKHVLCFVS